MALDNNFVRIVLHVDMDDVEVIYSGDTRVKSRSPQWWVINIYITVEDRVTELQTAVILKMEPDFPSLINQLSKDVFDYVNEHAPGKFIGGHLICRIRRNPGKVRTPRSHRR
jgi:hypothetical protein